MVTTKLTETEQETYDNIVKDGTMEDMFGYAYWLGRERAFGEIIEEMKSNNL